MSKTIEISAPGSFGKTTSHLRKLKEKIFLKKLDHYGALGVEALRNATPVNTGLTASSWSYEINIDEQGATITWLNSNVQKGWANVAVLLQYGHATKNGGYVEGIDYINPALKPIFDKLAKDAWEEVTKK